MTVEYAGAEPNGLAELVGGLCEANLQRHPERRALLRSGVVELTAIDAGVSVTLRLEQGLVTVESGSAEPRADVRVRADSGTLIQLSAAPLRLGLPDVATREGRAVIRKLLRRELRVRGMLRHPLVLARLTRLLSAR